MCLGGAARIEGATKGVGCCRAKYNELEKCALAIEAHLQARNEVERAVSAESATAEPERPNNQKEK